MILGFNRQFVDKILNGQKIHTIRKDSRKRWEKGKKIHFATGVRTKKYHNFKNGECTYTQDVKLIPSKRQIWLCLNGSMCLLEKGKHDLFVKNDGFDNEDDFWNWFDVDFTGVVIHWTDFTYILKSKSIEVPKLTTECVPCYSTRKFQYSFHGDKFFMNGRLFGLITSIESVNAETLKIEVEISTENRFMDGKKMIFQVKKPKSYENDE